MRVSSIALLLLVFGCAVAAQSQPKEGPQPPHSSAPTNQSSSNQKQPDAAAAVIQQPAEEPGDMRTEQPRNDPYQSVVAGSAVVQALSALVVMFFTGLLVWYNKRLLTATESAANAAASSAKIADMSLKTTQRPYLLLDSWEISKDREPQQGFVVRPVLVNSGPMPALNAHTGTHRILRPINSKEHPIPSAVAGAEQSSSIVGHGKFILGERDGYYEPRD